MLMNSISDEDLNLSSIIETPTTKHGTLYFPIFEDKTLILGIFYLRSPQAVIPLHDHPDMHGFIKVLHGTACVDSYNKKTAG